ncbi:hypothetical protein G9F72_019225 [Clostridium estertheticum]|uniref:hypothetical protein n=1 Tax=Clostridium estertheticum TaxID=238834 RepID=UPI0013E9743B|nr:hypothetical protein [Clostridium estertheticum]MBZ9688465.1 hypothetical protein [Clostridium estertheticum]
MEDLEVINLILSAYKQAIAKQIQNTNKGKQNKMRSSQFIEFITEKLKYQFPKGDKFVVFSKEMSKNLDFNRCEFLFDIHVCKVDTLISVKNKTVKYIKESVVEIESEFEKDTTKIAVDFSKLVCGNSKLKIMIVSICDNEAKFINSLKDIARIINGKIFLILLRHPSEWDSTAVKDYSILCFQNDDWVSVNI